MKYFSEKALEKKIEQIGGGGKTYSAGAGLDLNDTVFSIKGSVLAEIAKISDWFELIDGNIHVKSDRGFWTGGFISAGGLSSGGGAAAGNATLSNVTTTSATISADGVGSIDVYSKGYLDTALAQAGKVQSVVGQTGAVTAAQIGSALISGGYELTDHTYTNGIGLSLVGGEFSISTGYQTKIQSGEDAYTDLHNWFERINIGTEANPVWTIHVKSGMGFYGDSFVSAGGLSQGGGAAGGNASMTLITGGGSFTNGVDTLDVYSMLRVDQLLATAGKVQTVAGVSPTSGDIPVASLKSALGLGAAAAYGIGSVASGNTGLVTGGSVYSAINEAVSSVMKMQGTTTTPLSDGSTTNPIVIDGSSYTAKKGDVVLYDGKEYLWAGSAWEQLGDEASWALKTTSISAGTGLEGGGTLASNRTISINSTYQTYISHGESAYNSLGDYLPLTGGTLRAYAANIFNIDSTHEVGNNWIYFMLAGTAKAAVGYYSGLAFISNEATYARIGVNDAGTPQYWENTDPSSAKTLYHSGNSNLSTVDWAAKQMTANSFKLASGTPTLTWDSNANAWHLSGNFYADGFISAGGISPGGGSGGIDPSAMWQLLGASTNEQIAASHLTTALNGYATQSWVNERGYITGITSSMVTTALGYTPYYSGNFVAGTNYQAPISDLSTIRSNASNGNSAYNALGNYLLLAGGTIRGNFGCLRIQTTDDSMWVGHELVNSSGQSVGYYACINTGGGPYWLLPSQAGAYAIFHEGNLTKSVLTGLLDASGGYYLPLTGGTLKSAGFGEQLTIWRDSTTDPVIVFRNNTAELGRIGFKWDTGQPYWTPNQGTDNYSFYHTGNFNPSDYLSRSGGTMNNTNVVTNLNADLLDGHHNGDLTAQYFSEGVLLWPGDTINKLMSGVYCYINGLNPTGAIGNNTILLSFRNSGRTDLFQLVLDSNDKRLYYRGASNIGNAYESWGNWCEIYHSGNSNLPAVPWTCSTLTASGNIEATGTIHSSTGIYTEGYVTAGATSSSSDERLKSGIKNFGYSAEMLMALRPREWDWNEKSYMKGHAAGVVAQELQQVMPYAIVERQYLSVNYDMLHAVEIAGLQDHETRIRQLERENAELKRRLNMN